MADAISGIASPQSNYEKYKDMFTDKHDLVTMDNFYSLLIAEMQNQDPLEPTSNTEFISQMASFTALQAQQDTFETQQMSYANSLIGKTVTVSKGDGEVETGVVSYVKGGETPMINVNGTNYKLSAVSQVHDNGTQQSSSIGDYGAFASSILGKNAVVQSIDENGAAYYDEGTVSSLEIENGNVRVVVNGYAYNATDVLRVTQPVQEEQSIQNTFHSRQQAHLAAAHRPHRALLRLNRRYRQEALRQFRLTKTISRTLRKTTAVTMTDASMSFLNDIFGKGEVKGCL